MCCNKKKREKNSVLIPMRQLLVCCIWIGKSLTTFAEMIGRRKIFLQSIQTKPRLGFVDIHSIVGVSTTPQRPAQIGSIRRQHRRSSRFFHQLKITVTHHATGRGGKGGRRLLRELRGHRGRGRRRRLRRRRGGQGVIRSDMALGSADRHQRRRRGQGQGQIRRFQDRRHRRRGRGRR